MPALRTALVTVAAGGAAVATGVVATTATAAPAPVTAVAAVQADSDDPSSSSDAADHPGRHGARHWWRGLTDAQQECMKDADITRPIGPLDDDERAALRAQVTDAADACGVELPFATARAFWSNLSDEQQQCLKDADVRRPLGPMTREERQQVRADLRDAAEACGVELPERRSADAPAS
ncbi:hypothetical protein [uncultured Phycicoccus sp.]|uniref:hypothetical protein n=1 Tax=uncultured Phycicoccus sp. TaxID=661422 RepID=UPI0026316E7D|nr:hypothetical protein [uncultured Phycicoccus sp.]